MTLIKLTEANGKQLWINANAILIVRGNVKSTSIELGQMRYGKIRVKESIDQIKELTRQANDAHCTTKTAEADEQYVAWRAKFNHVTQMIRKVLL